MISQGNFQVERLIISLKEREVWDITERNKWPRKSFSFFQIFNLWSDKNY